MNIMYLKLKMGEKALPLRDMALENFPNVDLYETDIQADDYGEKAVLAHIIGNIKAGKYNKLYIKSLSEISRNASEIINIMNGMATSNPEFEIELKGGTIIKPHDLANQISFAVNQVIEDIDTKAEIGTRGQKECTDCLDVETKEGMGGMDGMQ